MKNREINEELVKLGLSHNEALIYTKLMEVGTDKTKNSAYALAKNLNIPRATIYLYLDRLINIKLVSQYIINNRKHYLAENPRNIEKDLIEKREGLNRILPLLEELRLNKKNSSYVRTYTGEAGVKLVLDEIFSKDNIRNVHELLCISNPLLSKILPKGFPEKLDKLKKVYDIHTKMILVSSADVKIADVYKNDSHRETRIMPDNYYFDGSFYLHNDTVSFISLAEEEIYSVIVDSKTITSMIRAFFMCTWDLLEDRG
jgi:sugar-specific transcriptional regulator TrmB